MTAYVSLFQFDDIVEVTTTNPDLRRIWGKKGLIRGMSQNEEDPSVFFYAVDIPATQCIWSISETDLKSTGRKGNPNHFETDSSIRVDEKGNIIDMDEG